MPLSRREIRIYEAETGYGYYREQWLNFLKALYFFPFKGGSLYKTKQNNNKKLPPNHNNTSSIKSLKSMGIKD